jgi:hypothetical protein
MTMQRLAVALTGINLVLLLALLGRGEPTAAQTGGPVLRGRALELVDDRGHVRSRLDVESDGEVVLRLLDRSGTIRVKLGAGEHGSGLVLLDETTQPGVHIVARRAGTAERPNTTSVTLTGVDGQPRVIRP